MHQVKLFSGEEDYRDRLELEINDWLRESRVRVVSIHGNIAPQTVVKTIKETPIPGAGPGQTRMNASSDILIVVVYEMDWPTKGA